MKRLTRILIWTVAIILGGVLLMSPLTVEAHPPLQSPADPQPDPPWLKSIYYGAVPPHNPDGPVLVFVHGYQGEADDWWTATPLDEVNDMYALAYEAGYRTAFASLGGSDGSETGSIWDNGQRLSRLLSIIARHYGVNRLDIVGHSKGGLDAQAAVVHFGGWRLVDHVFTLASPHQGSELADLLYSDWASWLGRLLGLQNDATYTLQTGYMQMFRSLTDPRVARQNVVYYRAAGTDTGPRFSGLWLSSLYLSRFGPNDGAVTVASTELDGAYILFIKPYHHYNILLGRNAFPWIDTALRDGVPGPNLHHLYLPLVAANAPQPPEPPSRSRVILRGGWLSGTDTVTETVPIESGALKVTFDLVVPDQTVTATLTAPDALSRPLEVVPPTEDGIFGSAWHLVHTEENPVPGEWVFEISSSEEAAYLLVAMVESPLEVTLHGWPDEALRPGDPIALTAQAGHPAGQPTVQRIEGHVTRAQPLEGQGDKGTRRQGDEGTRRGHPLPLSPCHPLTPSPPHPLTPAPLPACALALPGQEGVYAVSVTVAGQMPDGTPFERSFVRSVAVVTPATLKNGPTLLGR